MDWSSGVSSNEVDMVAFSAFRTDGEEVVEDDEDTDCFLPLIPFHLEIVFESRLLTPQTLTSEAESQCFLRENPRV